MNAHTPGPWITGNAEKAEDGRMVYCDDSLGSRVADCSRSGHGVSVQTEFANAKLISAAPEMLAILQDIYAADINTGINQQIRDVIAKATL